MTEQARQHHLKGLRDQLRSHEALLHTAQNEREFQHIADRINEFKRDIERCLTGPWVGPNT
jgi:hypothetical protein